MQNAVVNTTKHSLLAVLTLFTALAPAARAQTETVLFNFSTTSGDDPSSGVTPDPAGNLYGTAYSDGPAGFGVVYRFDRQGRYTVLHAFTGGDDGAYPYAAVTLDDAGNLYGSTEGGGTSNYGVIYKVDSLGRFSVLHSFSGGPGGEAPDGKLLLAPSGILYGVTYSGGIPLSYGSVYELDSRDPEGHFKVIHSFSGSDGASPYPGVIRDAAGNLYGTTADVAGSHGHGGVVYKLDPEGNETILHTFSGGADGANPFGGVILDPPGNLFGTTGFGGAFGMGVVYKLDPSGHETVLHSFAGPPADGAFPQASLAADASGNLYGTTLNGGSAGAGIVFKIDRTTHQESILYSFTGTDGYEPTCTPPILNGNLLGTTRGGGNGGGMGGVIFKINQ